VATPLTDAGKAPAHPPPPVAPTNPNRDPGREIRELPVPAFMASLKAHIEPVAERVVEMLAVVLRLVHRWWSR